MPFGIYKIFAREKNSDKRYLKIQEYNLKNDLKTVEKYIEEYNETSN